MNQMEQIEGGIQVEPWMCGDSISARALQIHPVVSAYCLGIAIGNEFYD